MLPKPALPQPQSVGGKDDRKKKFHKSKREQEEEEREKMQYVDIVIFYLPEIIPLV